MSGFIWPADLQLAPSGQASIATLQINPQNIIMSGVCSAQAPCVPTGPPGQSPSLVHAHVQKLPSTPMTVMGCPGGVHIIGS
jgi:hypothetical protein